MTRPIRRPRRAMSADSSTAPSAAPSTTVAPGAPASVCDPSRSLATIVATVTAAMCPVLPSATPANSAERDRRRARSRAAGERTVAVMRPPRYVRRSGRGPRRSGADPGSGGRLRRLGGLDRQAQAVRQLHLAGRPAGDPQQGRGAHHGRHAPRPRRRHVEAVERVQELHAPRGVLRRGRAHRVDADRALLALELVHGADERVRRGRPPRRPARSRRRGRCTGRRSRCRRGPARARRRGGPSTWRRRPAGPGPGPRRPSASSAESVALPACSTGTCRMPGPGERRPWRAIDALPLQPGIGRRRSS